MNLDAFPKTFTPSEHEGRLYQQWEASGAFSPNPSSEKEPFSILMPPPNANASLHAGHAMFVVQDILVRYKRMQGHPTAWFPGTDHAGYETQFVYEKHLKKEGKSRFQFDRETLYRDIKSFVQENSGLIYDQMRALGFSADWSQSTFTLDDKVLSIVMETFAKLEKDGLIYRDNYLVNYCPKCGTTFADLEVDHEERVSPLYYVRYRFSDGEPRIINGQETMAVTVATVRPETIFADVAIALHPSDPRAAALAGEYVLNPLTKEPIPVILDEYVDPEFGTGALKITPAHDPNDFKLGKKHNLPLHATITTMGKIDLSWLSPTHEPQISRAEQLKLQFQNINATVARTGVVKLLEAEGSLEKIDQNYTNQVSVCYKAKHVIEPLPYPNWFVKMDQLAKLGLEALETKEVRIIPQRFEKTYEQWLSNIRDWPISRQIVWGIRMPIWYDTAKFPNIFVSFLAADGERKNVTIAQALEAGHTLDEIHTGLQTLTAPMNTTYVVSTTSPGPSFIQETDTFDTWFSSGQWPLVVLGYPDGENFAKFYPTTVLDSMWDILFFWIARMIMLGKYMTRDEAHPTGRSPFKTVYLHSMVTDAKGAKMSKSKGNVINPLEIIEKFGADALRISLVAGSAPGNPIALSEPKVKGYRNFGNKIWNIGRFVWMQEQELSNTEKSVVVNGDLVTQITDTKRLYSSLSSNELSADDTEIISKLEALTTETTTLLEKYRFSDAALGLYDFIWEQFANGYLERNKDRADKAVYTAVVREVLSRSVLMLHPFMPFVTEAVWEQLKGKDAGLLITTPWPVSSK